jgi:hypothetical protein
VLRLDGKLLGLGGRELTSLPHALERVEPELPAKRLLDHLAIAATGPRGPSAHDRWQTELVAYDEDLAMRIREVLADRTDLSERKMFGGVAFMVGGHIVCGVIKDDLMLRLGEEGADEALDRSHTRVMDFTGRPSKGAVYVEPVGTADDGELRAWIERALAYVSTLPPKG